VQSIPLAPATVPDPLRGPEPFAARFDRMRRGTGRRRRASEAPRGGLRLGWKTWLAIDASCHALFLTAIVVWPPLSACRAKAYQVGLYAGDTVEKCTRRGVAERLDRADQRIKMLIRGSGR